MITLGQRLKRLRRELGLSQEAVGAQGFVSTPGWIKVENDLRQASEKLIDKLINWLVRDKHILARAAAALRNELLTLKYMGHRSPFVRTLAQNHARANGLAHLLAPQAAVKAKRGRPAATGKAVAP